MDAALRRGHQLKMAHEGLPDDVQGDVQAKAGLVLAAPRREERLEHLAVQIKGNAAAVVAVAERLSNRRLMIF